MDRRTVGTDIIIFIQQRLRIGKTGNFFVSLDNTGFALPHDFFAIRTNKKANHLT
jgi:hypothetical protein